MTIDELVYVISGHGMGTIGSKKMLLGPGDIAFLPRDVPHSLVSDGNGSIRLLGIAYPKENGDMKMVK